MGQPACRVGECYDAVLRSQIRRAGNGIYRESLYAGKLNLAPETLEEEVLQNVAIIVSTPKFSVPLDRGLGLAQRFIDKPIQVAQSILISEVLDAVEEYEPRAEVTNVTFEAGETPGLLVPVLEMNIVDNRMSRTYPDFPTSKTTTETIVNARYRDTKKSPGARCTRRTRHDCSFCGLPILSFKSG